jgi:hypothetical protein
VDVVASTSSSACERCGTFAPLKRIWGHEVCEPCATRIAPSRLAEKIAALVRTSWPLLLPAAPACMLAHVMFSLPFDVVEQLAEKWRWSSALTLGGGVISTFGDAAATVAIVTYLATGRWSTGQALSVMARRVPTLLALGLMYLVGATLTLLALVFPLLWFLSAYMIATQVVILEGTSAWSAMGTSRRRMYGMKLATACLMAPLTGLQIAVDQLWDSPWPWMASPLAALLAVPATVLSVVLYLEQRPWYER